MWGDAEVRFEIRQERHLNRRPYTVGFLTVVLMVALRVVIGWHFFQEGLAHKRSSNWSSEGFLRQAKGPLAEYFKPYTAGFHKWDQLVAIPLAAEPMTVANEGEPQGQKAEVAASDAAGNSPVYGKWYQEIVHDWNGRQAEIANFYRFSDEQKQSSAAVLSQYVDKLTALLAKDEEEIAAYRHELYRNQQMASQPGAEEIPVERARLARREQNPTGEPGISSSGSVAEWRSDVEALEAAWQHDVLALRSEEQVKLGQFVEAKSDLKKIDTAMTWLLIGGGGLLMVGLFTRLAAVALAAFLVVVVASQPPWMAGTLDTYFQGVECVALLVLASSHVGRWAGLDFFVHHVLLRPFRRA
jgi:uncharacterized membrane protein YphA (DoxX/SURF4 family)